MLQFDWIAEIKSVQRMWNWESQRVVKFKKVSFTMAVFIVEKLYIFAYIKRTRTECTKLDVLFLQQMCLLVLSNSFIYYKQTAGQARKFLDKDKIDKLIVLREKRRLKLRHNSILFPNACNNFQVSYSTEIYSRKPSLL